MNWPKWYAHVDGYVNKVGTTKDDLISWLLDGYTEENYVWGSTRAIAMENAKETFGWEWELVGYE